MRNKFDDTLLIFFALLFPILKIPPGPPLPIALLAAPRIMKTMRPIVKMVGSKLQKKAKENYDFGY